MCADEKCGIAAAFFAGLFGFAQRYFPGRIMSEKKQGLPALLKAPNLLTFSRVILAIIFFIFIYYGAAGKSPRLWFLLSLATFLVAIVTDWLDGLVARAFHMETAFGRIADPFVDKLLVCGAFIMFAFYLNGNPYMRPQTRPGMPEHLVNIAHWMAVVVIARELLISALRGYAESHDIKFGANVWGKQKMVLQSIAICAILAHQAVFNYKIVFAYVTTGLIWLAVLWTVLSGVTYVFRAKKVLTDERS